MWEVATVFLKLGLVAFGGPAAHVALMRREVVVRRGWVDEATFLRMFAACNLIPGPSSTELAVFLGYRRAGWPALAAAGALFILPAAVLMLLVAALYTRFSGSPVLAAVLYGVRPVVIGIVAWAAVDLTRRIVRKTWPALVLLVVALLSLTGLSPFLLLVAGGLATMALAARPRGGAALTAPFLLALTLPALPKLIGLFLVFLEIGALSFGSGYVLFAFLHAQLVDGLRLISERQLVDAVAIGQATPGPVFTTATFLGFLVAGVPGAALATIAIFLPGLALVPFLDRIVPAVERRPWAQAFVEGANAAAVGLVAAVTLQLGRASLVDPLTAAAAGVAFATMLRWPLASPALVAAGAGTGVLARLVLQH
jgi:chromate transporter